MMEQVFLNDEENAFSAWPYLCHTLCLAHTALLADALTPCGSLQLITFSLPAGALISFQGN